MDNRVRSGPPSVLQSRESGRGELDDGQDREAAIEDNVAYVESVLDVVAQENGEPGRLVFLGFSRGVAMAFRAAAHSRRMSHGVIALASDVPRARRRRSPVAARPAWPWHKRCLVHRAEDDC
jgi:dienelactone hydrolase